CNSCDTWHARLFFRFPSLPYILKRPKFAELLWTRAADSPCDDSEHFDLFLSGSAHFLHRGQDGRERLNQSLFQSLLDWSDSRASPSVTRCTHGCCVYARSPLNSSATRVGAVPESHCHGARQCMEKWRRGYAGGNTVAPFLVCAFGLQRPLAERLTVL
ncbi:hypothetical protein GOODEAATRI_010290, partial [Goodea atripinnis]